MTGITLIQKQALQKTFTCNTLYRLILSKGRCAAGEPVLVTVE